MLTLSISTNRIGTKWSHIHLNYIHQGRHEFNSFFKVTTYEVRSSGDLKTGALQLPCWVHFTPTQRGHVNGLHSSVPSKICHYQAATVKSITCFQTARELGVVLHVYCITMKTKSIMYCLSHCLALYVFYFASFLSVISYVKKIASRWFEIVIIT